jgi:hypothetical protein
MPVSFFGLYRADGTATAHSPFGRRGKIRIFIIAFSRFLNAAPAGAP